MTNQCLIVSRLSACILGAVIAYGTAQAQTTTPKEPIPAAGTQIGKSPFERAVGPTVADRGSELYTFSSFKLPSEDAKRHYWVQVGIPKRPAPSAGYPVIYMVDGNAAMGLIHESELEALDILSPPVLVAVGYDTYARVDTTSRAYDYTPPVVQNGKSITPIVRGRPGGGAELFTNFIEKTIKPRVEAMTKIDRNRQTLWGHSFGGLFTVYTLHAHPEYYQSYAAGDPSMWYHDGELALALLDTPKNSLKGKTIRLMSGGGSAAKRAAQGTAAAKRPQSGHPAAQDAPPLKDTSKGVPMMPDLMPKIATALQNAGADVNYRQFPGLNHGEMMEASLIPALVLAARP